MLTEALLSSRVSEYLPSGLKWKAFRVVNRVRWKLKGPSAFLKRHFRRFRPRVQCHACGEIVKPLSSGNGTYVTGVCPECSTVFEGVEWDAEKDYGKSFDPRHRNE